MSSTTIPLPFCVLKPDLFHPYFFFSAEIQQIGMHENVHTAYAMFGFRYVFLHALLLVCQVLLGTLLHNYTALLFPSCSLQITQKKSTFKLIEFNLICVLGMLVRRRLTISYSFLPQMITVNVSVNSNNNALFVLLISNNFMEIKSCVVITLIAFDVSHVVWVRMHACCALWLVSCIINSFLLFLVW